MTKEEAKSQLATLENLQARGIPLAAYELARIEYLKILIKS